MDRRHFLQLLLSAPPAVCVAGSETAAAADEPKFSLACGVCASRSVHSDHWLDIHVCVHCGAHETAEGWQAR